MTSPIYDKLQQVFCLNQIANSASDETGSQSRLQRKAARKIEAVLCNDRVRELIGTWEAVWGPVVWQHEGGDVADNTMFVARNTDVAGGNDEVVVAIAGTNPISWFGWLVEDFDVKSTVPWPYRDDTGDLQPEISQGTATGLCILLEEMKDGGRCLTDYLTTITGRPVDVTVTGHSLGGALSAATALALADQQGQEGGWDPERRAVVSALPSAGPTPGTADFAQYYTLRLGTRTNRIWNDLDIVPHAWQVDQLVQAPHLYYPYLAPNTLVELVVGAALIDSELGGTYVQINAQTPPLASQVYLDKIYTSESPLRQIEVEILLRAVDSLLAKLGDEEGWPRWKTKALQEVADWLLKFWLKGRARQGPVTLADLEAAGLLRDREIPEDAKGDLTELANEVDGLLYFLAQAAAQHVEAYPGLLGVNEFKQLADSIRG